MHALRPTQRGFTLIELMVVVAIIAILAAIFVPTFMGESNKVKADSEVAAIFAELRVREESYKVEHGRYLSTGTDEDDTYPTGPTQGLQNFLTGLPTEWKDDLRFQAPETKVRCAYVAIAGVADDATGTMAQNDFGMAAAPPVAWYYMLAHCDMDGQSAKDSYYFSSSMNSTLQSKDPGK